MDVNSYVGNKDELTWVDNLTSKTDIFFKPSNGQNGNFNNHKQLIIQIIFMASCSEEVYVKVLEKQAS